MKKYYLHNGTESSGPFAIEELKAQNITIKTPVWFEGLEKWKTAGEIAELKSIFVAIPPPIESVSRVSVPDPKPRIEETAEVRKILGLSITTFIIVSAILILIGGSLYINNLEQKRSEELELKNHKTEVENYQLELKQKALEEEKIQEIIQQKIDSEKIVREKKQLTNNRLLLIEQSLTDYQSNLDLSEKKLHDATSFKLLRTAAEKKEQMDLIQKNIDSFKNEITKLKTESNQLKLELEKIK